MACYHVPDTGYTINDDHEVRNRQGWVIAKNDQGRVMIRYDSGKAVHVLVTDLLALARDGTPIPRYRRGPSPKAAHAIPGSSYTISDALVVRHPGSTKPSKVSKCGRVNIRFLDGSLIRAKPQDILAFARNGVPIPRYATGRPSKDTSPTTAAIVRQPIAVDDRYEVRTISYQDYLARLMAQNASDASRDQSAHHSPTPRS